jgi:putative membrane protein
VLVVGLLRVCYFEKGGTYYGHSVPFMAKFALFVIVGLLSIYPTVEFLSWRKALQRGEPPAIPAGKMQRVRLLIHVELAAVVAILLCAALMARGIGMVG